MQHNKSNKHVFDFWFHTGREHLSPGRKSTSPLQLFHLLYDVTFNNIHSVTMQLILIIWFVG